MKDDGSLQELKVEQARQGEQIKNLEGLVDMAHKKLDRIEDHFTSIHGMMGSSNLLKKGLLAAIVAQALLYGIITPDAAKHVITTLIGAH